MENVTLEKKNVFISYCHKDVDEEWIDKLAITLGQYGINAIVDIYDLQLGQDLNYFMEQIKQVDKVLILLGKTYKEKANDREGGVGTETQIISNDVYKDVEQTKFIPIVVNKDSDGNAYIPYYLETRLYTDFSDDNLFALNMEKLVRQIHKLPQRIKPIVVEPPQSLVTQRTKLKSFTIEGKIEFDAMVSNVISEMENIKCPHNEFKNELDEIIVKKIEESKEIRDYFIKNLSKMLDENTIVAEDIISFLEKVYCVADSYKESTYYDTQNDACRFLLHEIIIYIVAILYKKRKYKLVSQLVNTTYFPSSTKSYVRDGICLSDFYSHLESLEDRKSRLKLNRKSIHADLLMQRASVVDMDIDFEDIRFADNLVLMLSEWFKKNAENHIYWYPVTIVYASYRGDDCLQLKKYLLSKSRFNVIYELFGIEDSENNNIRTKFINRYDELSILLKNSARRVDFVTIPSICSIVKRDDLFSLD